MPIKITQAGPSWPRREAELRKKASNIFHKESQNQKIFLTSGILGEVNTKMPIESQRARIALSDSTNSLSLLWLWMKDWDSQVGSTIRSQRRIGQIQQYCKPCKTCLHQAWTKPSTLSCSAVLSNSCSWIFDPRSQRCCYKSRAGSRVFLDGIYSRGMELMGCQVQRGF